MLTALAPLVLGLSAAPSPSAPTALAVQEARRGWLGVSLQEVGSGDAGRLLVVSEVYPGSPAERAGVQAGDRLLALDGQGLSTQADLARAFADTRAGQRAKLQIGRRIEARLGERQGRPWLGITLDRGPDLELPGDFGATVRVAEVSADSGAEQAGLRAGDLIVALNESPVEGVQGTIDAVRRRAAGDTLAMVVARTVDVRLGQAPEGVGSSPAADEQADPFLAERLETPPEAPPAPEAPRAGSAGGRGFLGVFLASDGDDAAVLQNVSPGGPAERAGLRPGDRILAIDHRPVSSTREASEALAEHRAGDVVVLTLAPQGSSEGETREVEVVLAPRATALPTPPVPGAAPRAPRPSGDDQAWMDDFQRRMETFRREWEGSQRDLQRDWSQLREEAERRSREWLEENPDWEPRVRGMLQWRPGLSREAEQELRAEIRSLSEELTELREELRALRDALKERSHHGDGGEGSSGR